MQDHLRDAGGADAPSSIEHLDLVTAELRRRIAGIGLAIAELREETGRLKASADGRYHAVSLLERSELDEVLTSPSSVAPPEAVGPLHPQVIDPTVADDDRGVACTVAAPVSPWGAPAPAATAGGAILAPDAPAIQPQPVAALIEPVAAPRCPVDTTAVAETALTWVPTTAAPAPEAVESPDVAVQIDDASPLAAARPQPWAWGDAGDDDAAFEAFFSAEIEPEPSQRWLLSD